jgi:hypothetical protein
MQTHAADGTQQSCSLGIAMVIAEAAWKIPRELEGETPLKLPRRQCAWWPKRHLHQAGPSAPLRHSPTEGLVTNSGCTGLDFEELAFCIPSDVVGLSLVAHVSRFHLLEFAPLMAGDLQAQILR